ncbi:MAG: leucine-rich repeat protein [Bacteroidaceae bacterium]|nr:leucine-rich repeat protein [Bacteroidaceae bacterium]
MRFPLRLMLLSVAMMLLGFSARAGSITREQAKAKAQSFLQAQHQLQGTRRLAPARTPVELTSTPTGEAALYVFNIGEEDGFVIVSGDDRTRSILGYADSGTFDADRVPAALSEMLAIYARQIEQLVQSGSPALDSLRQTASRAQARRRISGTMADVAPLLTTTWDQGDPYNAYCPTLNDQTALTGCVATAMAQIAYYHRYPTTQVPNLAAYTSATNKINVSAWGATTFDWDNMLPNYGGSYSNTEKTAVATLMRYCGQAAQMDYGFTSGAYNGDALNAFTQKLGYNANAEFRSAASYSANGWEDLIYKEVSENRPVYYSALNGDDGGPQCGGHAFVIDGYRADGNYFHVNWGWGGAYNGYFNLFALDPGAPESPVTSTGWHYQMLALVGLSPETVNTAKLTKDAAGSWLITSTNDWNELSANLDAYNGGTFKLTQDISVTTMVGTEWQPFSGTFDGQGHTLNVNIESDEWGAAPFNYVDSGTTIKNLKTQGTVTGHEVHASGLVGGTSNFDTFTLTITNCEVAVRVNGNGHAGGFIGHAIYMHPVFTDCVFSGSIYGCHDHGCFVGWKEWESRPEYINCLSIPTFFEGDSSWDFSHPGMGDVEHSILTNCYYSYDGNFSGTQGTAVTKEQLADGSVARALQDGQRDWTTGQVWGQRIGTDTTPLLTSDAVKGIYKVSFVHDGVVLLNKFTNDTLGDNMPTAEDLGMSSVSFTYNNTTFTGTTKVSSDIEVTCTGTSLYAVTIGSADHGSVSVTGFAPNSLVTITATPDENYVLSSLVVTDSEGRELPLTATSDINVFTLPWPASDITVQPTFIAFVKDADGYYIIDSEIAWNTLGNLVRGGIGTFNAKLTKDITVTTMIGTEGHPFSGVFDGQGHTLNVNIESGDEYTAPFHWTINSTFKNLTVAGTINVTEHFAGGLIGWAEEVTLQGCESKVTINSNYYGDGTHGGFISIVRGGTARFYDCIFSGTIIGENTDCCGGFCGWHDGGIQIYNCLNIGRFELASSNSCSTFSRNGVEVYNSYCISSLTDLVEDIQGLSVTPEQLAGGYVTYSLQSGLRDWTDGQVWGQALGTDESPILTSAAAKHVYRADMKLNGEHVLYLYMNSPVGSQMPTAAQLGLQSATFTYNGEPLTSATTFDADPVIEVAGTPAISLTIAPTEHGTVTVTPPVFVAGTEATVTTVPDEGYGIMSVTVTDADGNDVEVTPTDNRNVYTFIWPAKSVTVKAEFSTPISLAVNVTEPGTIGAVIDEAAKAENSNRYFVKSITVTGNINQDDLRTLSEMCTGEYILGTIDLSGASIEDNYIDNNMFRDREKLTSIILPETLEYINDASFYNCDGLTSIDIPASVKRIWSNAFNDCSNLATVTGLEGLSAEDSYWAWDPFWATAITEPVYGGSVFLYMPPSISGEYEIPAGIRMSAAGSFRQSRLSSVTLPASLTVLGDDTFQDCSNLTDIYCYATVPPTCVSGVWEYGFDRGACTVYVPASAIEDYQNADEWRDMGRIVGIVTGELADLTINVATAGTLGDALFDAAVAAAQISDKVLVKNLTVTGSINADDVAYLNALPATLYNMYMLDLSGATLEGNVITERMFYATLYKSIALPAGITSIASEAFCDSRRLLEITLPAAITTIEPGTFNGCSSLQAVTFAENSALKRIEEYAFAGLSSLKSITLPESLEYIGPHAFENCGLTSIVIPDGVTETGDRVLQSCRSLKSITIGNGMTNIPDCWAEFCDNIEEVVIGKKVTSIRWRAFPGFNIKNVYSYAKSAPSWDDAFYDGINSEAVLHVYSNCVNRYQNANGWLDFPTIVGDLGTYPTFELAVNVAEMGTFSEALAAAMTAAGCEDKMDITKLTVTGTVNEDDLYYLRDNLGATLDALDLGAVTVDGNCLGDTQLARCGFEEVVLPDNITILQGWGVLEGCVNLKTVNIPSSVTYVCPRILNGATSLETVTGGEGVVEMDGGNGMYFDNCPNLQSPVILNTFFFRLPSNTEGAYEVPEGVTAIARDAMWNVNRLTAITLPESITTIYGNVFANDVNLKDIYFYAVELPTTDQETFGGFDRSACTLHVYEEMVELFQNDDLWSEFNIVGDLGAIPNLTPINEADYADLCNLYNTLGGDGWRNKWMTNKNVQTASRWRGVTFDEDGYVTGINLEDNGLNGDISSLTFAGMSRLTEMNLSRNAITGDIRPLLATLNSNCDLNVAMQNLGYVGEHTLYELCNYGGLPSIAYYQSGSGQLASTLIGVNGVCQFYHEGTDGGHYWDCYIYADGGTWGNFKFYWPSPATVECFQPHHFTFTYRYEMGDANMDDAVNVLDLQSTLNYSNNQSWGLFNFYAADTYGPDDDINVQDIVATVNMLLAQEGQGRMNVKALAGDGTTEGEACLSVEDGQLVLYTTKPVAALDLRLAGIGTDDIVWKTEDMGFVTATKGQGDTHAIIYSMLPRQIEEGRTVIATFDGNRTPRLVSAVLCDDMARPVVVGGSIPTQLHSIAGEGIQSAYDLRGIKVDSPQQKGVYIVNGKKVVIK